MKTTSASRKFFQPFAFGALAIAAALAMAATPAHAALLTYYDFEDSNLTSDSPGLQVTNIAATTGMVTFTNGGTNVNAVTPSTNVALGILNAPVSFTLGGLATTGLMNVNLSFALGATGSPFTTLNLLYNTNGGVGAYASLATNIPVGAFTADSFDASALSGGAVNNVSNLFFEFSFTGGNNGGAVLVDNIQVNAVSSAVPDSGPTLLLLFLALAAVLGASRLRLSDCRANMA